MPKRKQTSESVVSKQCVCAASHLNCTVLRNNVGQGMMNGRYIKFGLQKGSGDFIGWTRVKITKEMLGKTIGVFTSIEMKTATGEVGPAQENWIEQVRNAGGIAFIARRPEDVVEHLTEPIKE